MKLRYVNSATILIDDGKTSILTDPWLVGTTHYGSWNIYPELDIRPEDLHPDYIWVSHIHNDHVSMDTLERLDKDIPVIIHRFPNDILRSYIERAGFEVIELENNMRTRLKGDMRINIVAGDDCDPEVCGKVLGCSPHMKEYGTLQIDSMSVIDSGGTVIVNTNDTPFPIGRHVAKRLKKDYGHVDMALIGYRKAMSYPEMYSMDHDQLVSENERMKTRIFGMAMGYIDVLKPRYYMPFAGEYTISGKHAKYQKVTGEAELHEAVSYMSQKVVGSKVVALNQGESFDLDTGIQTKPFVPDDADARNKYVDRVLSRKKYTYEGLPQPSKEDILNLMPKSYERFERARNTINWRSDTSIAIMLDKDSFLLVPCDGSGWRLLPAQAVKAITPRLVLVMDAKLLYLILQGPKHGHWSVADIGLHVIYKRVDCDYERGLYYCLYDLYS